MADCLNHHAPRLTPAPVHCSRRLVIGALGGLALSATTGNRTRARRAQAGSATPEPAAPLGIRGISYDVGTVYVPGLNTIPEWDLARAGRDLATIRHELGCSAVTLFGSDPVRLREAAALAAEQELAIWLQPRLIDGEPDAIIDQLLTVARDAARLRAEGTDVTLNLGVELTLFATGIIPGDTFLERVPVLLETLDQLPRYNVALNALLADARTAVREVFAGPISYGSGPWEGVDWRGFDFVGVDLYRDATNEATYVEQLRGYRRFDKPVVITEFGCCCYEGAAALGASGYDIIDWSQEPPVLAGEYIRNEQVQADYLTELLTLYEAEGIAGAFVFTFVEPDYPYSPAPEHDLDMASFGIVKVLPAGSGRGYFETGHWEPKRAFHALAERFDGSAAAQGETAPTI